MGRGLDGTIDAQSGEPEHHGEEKAMVDQSNLIAKLEAATEGSRELDACIERYVNPDALVEGDKRMYWAAPDSNLSVNAWFPVPAYTTSLDDALTLVPEGWKYQVSENEAWVSKLDGQFLVHSDTEFIGRGNSGPLSLCIAALRAGEQCEV